jgi:hypothetical protein
MRWNFFSSRDPLPISERFRREHEAWLDAVIRSGRAMPRIPLRREDDGGFRALRQRAGGRQRAEQWWSLALKRAGDIGR